MICFVFRGLFAVVIRVWPIATCGWVWKVSIDCATLWILLVGAKWFGSRNKYNKIEVTGPSGFQEPQDSRPEKELVWKDQQGRFTARFCGVLHHGLDQRLMFT